jgi:hypothetical protein
MKYRMLRKGEVVRSGDELCCNESNIAWVPCCSSIGTIVGSGLREDRGNKFRRPIVESTKTPRKKAAKVSAAGSHNSDYAAALRIIKIWSKKYHTKQPISRLRNWCELRLNAEGHSA